MTIGASEVAKILERSTVWFYRHREKLEAAGFPKRDELLGGWHESAVRDWKEKRAAAAMAGAVDGETQGDEAHA